MTNSPTTQIFRASRGCYLNLLVALILPAFYLYLDFNPQATLAADRRVLEMVCTGLFMLIYLAVVYAFACACSVVIRVDNAGISVRGLNGSHYTAWNQVVRIEERASKAGTILHVNGGRKLSVPYNILTARDRQLLSDMVNEHSALVRQQMINEQMSGRHVINVVSKASAIMVVLVVLLLPGVFIIVAGFIMARASALGTALGICTLFSLGGGTLIALAVYIFNTITVSIELDDTSITRVNLVKRETIFWKDIDSVSQTEITGNQGPINRLTIQSGTRKISVASTIPNYSILTAAVMSKIPGSIVAEHLSRSRVESERINKSFQKQRLVIGMVGLPIVVTVFSYSLYVAVNRLYAYHIMHTQGLYTTGAITSKEATSSRYILNFSFSDGGKKVLGASPVTSTVFNRMHRGEPATVIYIPNSKWHMLDISSGEAQATFSAVTSCGSLVLTLLLAAGLLKKSRSKPADPKLTTD